METEKAISLLKETLSKITTQNGLAATDDFASLREVEAQIRQTRMLLSGLSGLPESFISEWENDNDFEANSRRVRLEALIGYINNALTFLQAGGINKSKKKIYPPPDVSKLTNAMPGLDIVIERRWKELQKCQHVGAFTATIILMGSVLEALLLCRASLSSSIAHQSRKAPKNKEGKAIAIHEWNLNTLIEVAVDCKWLKIDRGKFGHALRSSRNVVHPWEEVSTNADFDEATCRTSWEVLNASVTDLLGSI